MSEYAEITIIDEPWNKKKYRGKIKKYQIDYVNGVHYLSVKMEFDGTYRVVE